MLLKISFKIPLASWPVTTFIPMLLTGLLPHRIKYMIFLCVLSWPARKWLCADKFWHLPCSGINIGKGEGRSWETNPGNTKEAARDALKRSPQEPSLSTWIPPGHKAHIQNATKVILSCWKQDIRTPWGKLLNSGVPWQDRQTRWNFGY